MSISEILSQASIFSGLSYEQLDMVAGISNIVEYNAGDTIFQQNGASDELYVIIEGEVDIEFDPALANGPSHLQKTTFATLRRGQTFGEIALVDRGIRAATARSGLNDTRLVVIPQQELMSLCEAHPQLGFLLMHNLARGLAAMIRASDSRAQEWSIQGMA